MPTLANSKYLVLVMAHCYFDLKYPNLDIAPVRYILAYNPYTNRL